MQSVQTYALQWAGLGIEVRYCPSWSEAYAEIYGYLLAHLEIDASGQPLPVTETGYLSHFDRADNIEALGGPVVFVLAWLDQAAATPEWQAAQAEREQLSLF